MTTIFKPEYLFLLLSLLLFMAFPWLSRSIDAGAAPLDPGVLSITLMALLSFLVFKCLTWLLIRSIWPALAEYAGAHFAADFSLLSRRMKVCLFLGFYLSLLGMMIWCMNGVT